MTTGEDISRPPQRGRGKTELPTIIQAPFCLHFDGLHCDGLNWVCLLFFNIFPRALTNLEIESFVDQEQSRLSKEHARQELKKACDKESQEKTIKRELKRSD